MATAQFEIAQECTFNNGNLLTPLLKDKSSKNIEVVFRTWLFQNYTLVTKKHTSKSFGSCIRYSADDINK